MSRLMSVSQAAEYLGVSKQRVHVLIQKGFLKGEKLGEIWVVDRKSVEKRKTRLED